MIVLFTVTILSVSALSNNAYAGGVDRGMTLSAEGSGSTIAVSGDTDRSDFDVTVIVTASNGNKVVIDQLSVVGGSFSTSINVSALDDGTYTIAVNQGQSSRYNLSVDIEVSGGTSDSSVSISNVTDKDEESYVLSENAPTTQSLKKLTITASGMEGSNTINVSGTTDRSDEIIIKVLAPNRNLVSVDQITPTADMYSTTIKTGGPLWSQDGMYMITASQTSNGLKASTETFSRATDSANAGLINYQASAEVEILDGHVIPEFGVIAAMILAVAIVSIIVITAKTRLSLVPRY